MTGSELGRTLMTQTQVKQVLIIIGIVHTTED